MGCGPPMNVLNKVLRGHLSGILQTFPFLEADSERGSCRSGFAAQATPMISV